MIQGAFGAELDPFCIIKIIVNLRGQGWEIMAIRLGIGRCPLDGGGTGDGSCAWYNLELCGRQTVSVPVRDYLG